MYIIEISVRPLNDAESGEKMSLILGDRIRLQLKEADGNIIYLNKIYF